MAGVLHMHNVLGLDLDGGVGRFGCMWSACTRSSGNRSVNENMVVLMLSGKLNAPIFLLHFVLI